MSNLVARFAPSPTGFLHIGGLRTALINYIFIENNKAKYPNSKFLIRIEDTDKIRSKNEYIESILNGLRWTGIKWDDDIFIQSKKIDRHKAIAYDLLNNGNAFKCICSSAELEKKRAENLKNKISIKRLCTRCENDEKIQNLNKNYCIRLKIPNEGDLSITDRIQGNVTIDNKEIDNFILLRENGDPTYMLSVVVDDHDMGVNTIIRGNDHFNNAFRQIHIYKKLNWAIPNYAHLPLIHGIDGIKLSKRHGDVDVNEFKHNGYLPQAIINNLILLGWSPNKKDEIIGINEIIKIFDIDKISKSSSIFNYEKLNYLNNHYLKKKENYVFFENFIQNNKILKSYNDVDNNKIKKIFEIYNKKIKFYGQIENIAKIYFNSNINIKSQDILNNNFSSILKDLMIKMDKIKEWDTTTLDECISQFVKDKKIKFIDFGKPMRLILINLVEGPSISDIFYILGKKNSFIRLNNYINRN